MHTDFKQGQSGPSAHEPGRTENNRNITLVGLNPKTTAAGRNTMSGTHG